MVDITPVQDLVTQGANAPVGIGLIIRGAKSDVWYTEATCAREPITGWDDGLMPNKRQFTKLMVISGQLEYWQ